MAQKTPPVGLSTYFSHVAYDLDLNRIGELGNRRYLEHRIHQVERWVALHYYRIERTRRHGKSNSSELTSLTMDLAYLMAVRQALMESLSLLPGT